jgi:hypothetical protein
MQLEERIIPGAPDSKIQKITAGIGFSRFSSMKGIDSNGTNMTGGFTKLTPSCD